jgi:dTDP-4-amino-4,6-dideoxygalactose transaminase
MYYLGQEELDALEKVFAKRKLFRYQSSGPTECDLFEAEFSKFVGSRHSILLSSGTNSLLAALLASSIKPGDEVLVPTYTFIATAAAVALAGAHPVLVNIDSELGICPIDAAKKITSKTKAVIPVHMDGLSADIKGVLALAEKHNLVVIEDAAQAIGGSYDNRSLGTFGSFGCFSLNENKSISCGEGGILITSDRALYEKAFCIHDGAAQFNPTKKDFFQTTQAFLGSSMRVSEIQGAIMRVQLSRLDKILTQLRERKNILIEHLSNLSDIKILRGHCKAGDCASSLHLQFADPGTAVIAGQRLRQMQLPFIPVTARPAHASWKWKHLFREELRSSDVLESMSILSRTLKMDVPISATLEETERSALQIKSCF